MAISATKIVATPYSLKYYVDSDAGGAVHQSSAALLADMMEGPLKRFASQLSAAAWATLLTTAATAKYTSGLISSYDGTPAAALSGESGGLVLTHNAAGKSIIELRYHGSLER